MTSQDTAAAQPKPLKRVALNGLGNALADTRLAPEGEMDPLIWLVAAHGGAGATYLAHALAPFGDAGQLWPVHDKYPWCVIVARTTRAGLEAAHDLALQDQSNKTGGCRVLGIILVADAPGKLPRSLEQRITVLEKTVPTIWRVDYFDDWRESTVDELPQWSPLDDEPEEEEPTKFWQKKKESPDLVHKSVRSIGQDLVERAREANKHL
ncbi:hypothetical protein MHX62_10070 [Corynebacterium sp. ACRQM]|uniref:Uncharacterized protein n=1 Tax=Corynebacterium pseudogenitalium ATCC 33035 TaxID=525264 RepID=E2S773_9CORY|nr:MULTISPECIES: DUF6668 family protein [Corynebacterium]MCG7272403.1 hypothetical protein [Corynebacterium sp. ACRQM]HCD4228645.1 hypothetical protein [Corynebacterium striatum]EFQ79361.1 hypothetical protein HMPREF0305_12375 [Corynebacterium pseudogenitalium ATCC 33035]MCG7234448.1 hypothetical protein [Corynebacterium sp. ACRPR]MDU4729758.1 DUF6668 family protein [Corynebacterium sp.]